MSASQAEHAGSIPVTCSSSSQVIKHLRRVFYSIAKPVMGSFCCPLPNRAHCTGLRFGSGAKAELAICTIFLYVFYAFCISFLLYFFQPSAIIRTESKKRRCCTVWAFSTMYGLWMLTIWFLAASKSRPSVTDKTDPPRKLPHLWVWLFCFQGPFYGL